MNYSIEFKKSAIKEIAALPRAVQIDIKAAIDKLVENPFPNGCLKLKGREDDYRIRIGDYRVIYQVKNNVLTIHIVKVGHRKDIY